MTKSVMFPPGLMLARVDAYREIGGFDEGARHAEDWDALIRLTRLGSIAFLDEVVLDYRRHEANLGTSREVPRACARVRRKAYFSADNNAEQRRIVRDSWRAAQVIDAQARWTAAKSAVSAGRVREAFGLWGRLPLVALRFMLGRPSVIDSAGRG